MIQRLEHKKQHHIASFLHLFFLVHKCTYINSLHATDWQGTCPPANLRAWLCGIAFRLIMQKSTILKSPSLVSSFNSSGKTAHASIQYHKQDIWTLSESGAAPSFFLLHHDTTLTSCIRHGRWVVTHPLRSSVYGPSGKWLLMSTT